MLLPTRSNLSSRLDPSLDFAVGAFSVWTLVCCFLVLNCLSGARMVCKHRWIQGFKPRWSFGFGTQPHGVQVELSSTRGASAKALSSKWWILILMICCRVGEASHPGPSEGDGSSWSVGLCNPSGIHSKVSQINQLEGDVWFVCETHLSQYGVSRFRKGLVASRSEFKHFVHGAPCVSRSSSQVGGYSGVGVLSRIPLRALPHSFCEESFATARIQVVGFVACGVWIQAGVLYGYPDSQQFLERTFQTDCLLQELVDRIAIQGQGPRLICGDFNHGQSDLRNCERLRQLGFCEAQSFALHRWGIPIQTTSRGKSTIDQIWLSAELQQLLQSVEIRDSDWADHSSLVCHFTSHPDQLSTFHWRMPQAVSWPTQWNCWPQIDWTQDPSFAYASFWFQVESACESQVGLLPASAKGRGQTLDSRQGFRQTPPCKIAREGDFQPRFHGPSLQHLQWVKQLRRCQSLRRLLASSSTNELHRLRLAEVWSAVRLAKGFPGGFCAWWAEQFPAHEFAKNGFPLGVPSLQQAVSLVVDLKRRVEAFEAQLIQGRIHSAKSRRKNNLQLLFQDCAKEQPSKVDSLVQSVEVGVDRVDHSDCSVVLQKPVTLSHELPLVIGGKSREVLACCEDQVWLSDVTSIQPGDVARQDNVSFSDQAILSNFETVWEARWNKISHLSQAHWLSVNDFIRQRLSPIQWDFPQWDIETLCAAVKGKKRASATGPDGVSRGDLLALPSGACQEIVRLFAALEDSECPWPMQLVTGFVTSLNKEKGNGGVDSYRPVTIYPLLYRI